MARVIKHLEIGEKVEPFALTDPDGNAKTLGDIAGKRGIVVGFMHGTYCPHCLQQLSRSNRIADKLGEHHVSFAWVLRDKPTSILAYTLATNPPPRFIVLPDNEPTIAQQFGIPPEEVVLQPAPFMFYVDAEGIVRHVVDKSENPHAPIDLTGLIEEIKVPE